MITAAQHQTANVKNDIIGISAKVAYIATSNRYTSDIRYPLFVYSPDTQSRGVLFRCFFFIKLYSRYINEPTVTPIMVPAMMSPG